MKVSDYKNEWDKSRGWIDRFTSDFNELHNLVNNTPLHYAKNAPRVGSITLTTYLEWDDSYPLSENGTNTKQRRRVKMRMNVITNEMQWFVQTDALNYGSFTLRAVSYEGVTLGNKVDLR